VHCEFCERNICFCDNFVYSCEVIENVIDIIEQLLSAVFQKRQVDETSRPIVHRPRTIRRR